MYVGVDWVVCACVRVCVSLGGGTWEVYERPSLVVWGCVCLKRRFVYQGLDRVGWLSCPVVSFHGVSGGGCVEPIEE